MNGEPHHEEVAPPPLPEEEAPDDAAVPLERAPEPEPPADTAAGEAPPPASSSASSGSSASFADLWEAAYRPPRDSTRWVVAAALLAGLFCLSLPFVHYYDDHRLPTFTLPAIDAEFGPPRSLQGQWEEDARAAQGERMPWDPLARAAQPGEAERRAPQPERRKSARSHPAAAAPVPPAPAAPERSIYDDLWGPSDRYAAASSLPSTRAGEKAAGATDKSVKGTLLYARLKDKVASAPAGAEVIAVLSHKALLGPIHLPSGTQLHGSVAGAEDTRVFVSFAFARFSDGRTLTLQGAARDEQGRLGIPGKKLFTAKSVASIGVSSTTRALSVAGRELAGAAGAIVGAGIEGATDSGTDKARRADNDEYILIAEPGKAFQIYVQAAATDTGSS